MKSPLKVPEPLLSFLSSHMQTIMSLETAIIKCYRDLMESGQRSSLIEVNHSPWWSQGAIENLFAPTALHRLANQINQIVFVRVVLEWRLPVVRVAPPPLSMLHHPVGCTLVDSSISPPRLGRRPPVVHKTVCYGGRLAVQLAPCRYGVQVGGFDRLQRTQLVLVAHWDLVGLQGARVARVPVPLKRSPQLFHHRGVLVPEALRLTDHQARPRVEGELVAHPVQVSCHKRDDARL